MSPAVAAWISLASTVIIFLLGLALVPTLKNLVNDRIGAFEERFSKLEETAHAGIIDAVGALEGSFHEHNTDPFAHANLTIHAEVKTKLEELRKEIVELRISFETRASIAQRAARAGKKKKA